MGRGFQETKHGRVEKDESLPLSFPKTTTLAGYPFCVLTFDIRGETVGRKHISGSAYKIVAQRAYHHGTMLISSDLGSLGVYLKSQTVSPIHQIRIEVSSYILIVWDSRTSLPNQ